MKGKLITLEGPEGAGKSTQAAYLRGYLLDRGYDVLNAREPGGTPMGEAIRPILQHNIDQAPCAEAELLLFYSARAQLVRQVLLPEMEKGIYIIMDRFFDSSIAYQGYGRGLDLDFINRLTTFALGSCRPDITFLLDLPIEDGFKRLAARKNEQGIGKKDRMESESPEFHQRIREGYLEMAGRESRFAVIDANRPEEEVFRDITQEMHKRKII